jgi:hypothetical protein
VTINRDPTLSELINVSVAKALSKTHTAMPGRVESYDSKSQTADIQPLIDNTFIDLDRNEVNEPYPKLQRVPVWFPRGGGYFQSLPVQEGDTVLLIFNERSTDRYNASDSVPPQPKTIDPIDIRMHHLSDAIAIPGFFPLSQSLSDAHSRNMVMGKDGGTQIHVKDEGISLGSETPTDFVALAQLVSLQLAAISASITNLITLMSTHTHQSTAGAPAFTGVADPVTPIPYSPGNVASTVVRSE